MLRGGKCHGENSSWEGEQEIWGRRAVLQKAILLRGFYLEPNRKAIRGLEEGSDVIWHFKIITLVALRLEVKDKTEQFSTLSRPSP